MIIEWFGQSCLKIQTKPTSNGEVVVVFDPYDSAKIGLKLPKLSGDILAITHDHHDHNYAQGVSGNPFTISGAGEYEVKGVFIYGIPSFHDDKQGAERGPNTIYLMESEGLTVAHLGDFGQASLTTEQMSYLEGVDILILPVGGVYTIGAKVAAELVSEIEPRIVIPIHYKLPGLKVDLEAVEKFVKEVGLKPQLEEKLKVVKKDLPVEETKLIVLGC
ncbi:MAG: MBL fold metallo-hydrolase [Patescibacteria group bacterium]